MIGSLDPTSVAMVCVTYVDIVGSPPHMRYLLRRVRQRLPNCPILVGFWAPSDPFLDDTAAQGMAGGTAFVSSLRDAVSLCLAEAHKSAGNSSQ